MSIDPRAEILVENSGESTLRDLGISYRYGTMSFSEFLVVLIHPDDAEALIQLLFEAGHYAFIKNRYYLL